MSGSIVNVLTPHGRRQNVKVQPNTALLKVLDEVCEKYKFDSNEYDLKHHKRILDLTTSYRFSGLPNNAQLEMVEAQKKRQDAEVELVVQLGDGIRLDGKFKPNVTLLNIIQQLCPNELTGDDLFAIYMRTEVANDKLESTSLKELGLISGRAIIRLIHRDPNAAKIQANVALNLAPKPSGTKDDMCDVKNDPTESKDEEMEDREQKIRKTDDESKKNTPFSLMIQNEIEKKKQELAALEQKSNEANSVGTMQAASSEFVREQSSSMVEEEKMDVCTSDPSNEPFENTEEDGDSGEIYILGDRSAVLFEQDAAKAVNNDLPDSFYDLSVKDLKYLIRGLRTQAEGSIEQPLMTAKLREMEEEQKQLSALNRYKAVIIRIQFPNRYVLQGTFTPYETIETVTEFVRLYLANPNIEFYLYTTPPKNVLSKESHLFEANCVPSAILHFGSEDRRVNYLKEDILGKVSSPKASLLQALTDRGMKELSTSHVEHEALRTSTSSNENKPSTSQQSNKSISSSDIPPIVRPSTSAKPPKWFKPFAK